MDTIMEEINSLRQYLKEVEELECDDLNDEIIEIKNNLNEVIKSKTEQLLEIRRSELLTQCCDLEESLLSEEESPKFDIFDDSVGRKVGVSFTYNNGSHGIRRAEIIGKRIKDDTTRYNLVYLHPIYTSEHLCPSVKENYECEISNCKYNHGVEVNEDQLRDLIEEKIYGGGTCLVQLRADELWTRGKVLHIDIEAGTCVVELMDRAGSKLDLTYNVDLKQVISHKDSSLEDSIILSDDSDSNDVMITSVSSSQAFMSNQDRFGYWETHTKGIGLKLLMKMGYRMGDGLGANNQGRVLPVTISPTKKKKKTTLKPHKKVVTPVLEQPLNLDIIGDIKTAIVRNHDKLSTVKEHIEQLEQFKCRNKGDHYIVRSTDDRIFTLKKKLVELQDDEKTLIKKQSKSQKKKKLDIF